MLGLLLCVLAAAPIGADAGCRLLRYDLPVTMAGQSPVVDATFNGLPARLVLDSGAFWSTLNPGAVRSLPLEHKAMPSGYGFRGVGGDLQVQSIAVVKDLQLARISIANAEFIVAGNEKADVVGNLGQEVLHRFDVEYDLSNGMARLVQPNQECGGRDLAYWADVLPHSVIDLETDERSRHATVAIAFLNGKRLRVLFDTGATLSVLSLGAANRLGIGPGSKDVQPDSLIQGYGSSKVASWIGPLQTFRLGDEEIRDTRIHIADLGDGSEDLILGMDFFLSHRIYVANSQHKLYFNYKGGPVFSLSTEPSDRLRQGPETDVDAAVDSSEPTTASAYSRRGMGFLARRDPERAIADLSHACELDPNTAAYFYQRALAYMETRSRSAALADLHKALSLDAGLLHARLLRAELYLRQRDYDKALKDLDEVDRVSAPDSDVRFQLAIDYQRAGAFAAAVNEFDHWVAAHPHEVKLPHALATRCRSRAFGGIGLELALADCNQAVDAFKKLESGPDLAEAQESRGFVYLRFARYDRAAKDFAASLKGDPHRAWSLVGRALVHFHEGRSVEARTDLSAAETESPGVAAAASGLGFPVPEDEPARASE